ncbi:MAG: DUF5995 family protein [Candidatus Saccharimonadales bacterium]
MSSIEGSPPAVAVPNDIELALTKPVDTVESVLDNFAEVGPLLVGSNLAHVETFWRVYGDVTDSVNEGLQRGIFKRPDDVRHTLPLFYDFARWPLLAYVRGEPDAMDSEWRRSLYDPRVVAAMPGIQFLSQMNSHIANDLGRALRQSKVSDEYKPDFTIMVGKKLDEVASRHAQELIPLQIPALRGLTLATCLKYIDVTREIAWHDGKRLLAAHGTPEEARIEYQIKRNALRQGKVLHHSGTVALNGAIQLEAIANRVSRLARAA